MQSKPVKYNQMKTVRKDCEGKPSYTHVVVSFAADDHRSFLISKNGKLAGNESVKNAKDLTQFLSRYINAVQLGKVEIVKMDAEEFRSKYPKFPLNAGPKRKK